MRMAKKITLPIVMSVLLGIGCGPDLESQVGDDTQNLAQSSNQQEMNIVTYNMFTHNTAFGYRWKTRLTNFARHVIFRYRPAIVVLNEVYQWSDCFSGFCGNCEKMDWGYYLNYFLTTISNETGYQYKIATNVRSGSASVCFSKEMGGEATIYDPSQVTLVPIPPKANYYGCMERRKNVDRHYGHQNTHNDCLRKGGQSKDSYTNRAIFEFPKNSSQFFSVYNAHGDACDVLQAVDFIQSRQNTLRKDIENYFASDPNKKRPFKIYPPIFGGDRNSHTYRDCNNTGLIYSTIRSRFVDAPMDAYDPPNYIFRKFSTCKKYLCSADFKKYKESSLKSTIDKVLVGRNRRSVWDYDVPLFVMPPDPFFYPFTKKWHGAVVYSASNWFSDHSPAIVRITSDPSYVPDRHDCSAVHPSCPQPCQKCGTGKKCCGAVDANGCCRGQCVPSGNQCP